MGTKKQRTPTEIRDDIERRLFNGTGDSYIAWWHAEDRWATYRFSKAHRPSNVSHNVPALKLVKPLHKHQSGYHHGLCIDQGTTHVPFIAVDHDRHTASVCPVVHLNECQIITEIVTSEFSDFFVQGEVNPLNGSAKWFLWPSDGFPIYLPTARKIAQRLNARIKERIGHNIEVFPDNCKKIALPCREDKTTIIDTGYLPCNSERWRMDTKDLTEYGWLTDDEYWELANKTPDPKKFMNERKSWGKKKHRVHYESYDYRAWGEFLKRGQNLDTDLFLKEIEKGCQNLPYQEAVVPVNDLPLTSCSHEDEEADIPHSAPPRCGMRSTAQPSNRLTLEPTAVEESLPIVVPQKPRKTVNLPSMDELREEPNSYTRQLTFCLNVCRKAKRVVEIDEALALIHKHEMFTGDWSENEWRRRNRVRGILNRIERTFDPDKLGSGTTIEIDFARWMKWARDKFTSQRRVSVSYSSGFVSDDMSIIRSASEYKRYCRFDPDNIGATYAIISFCMNNSEHGDGGVPEVRGEAIWNIYHDAGVLKEKWNVQRFRAIRDLLHDRDIIKCDYDKRPGKAYCYSAGKFNPEHPTWKNKAKRLRIASSSSPYQYKQERLNTESVYYTPQLRDTGLNRLFWVRERPPP